MMGETIQKPITSFKDLHAWKRSHVFALEIFSLTRSFPSEMKYSLSDQLNRAAISVTSNIAEGFSRHGKKDKIRFYSISLGSLTEIQSQLFLAKDLGLVPKDTFNELHDLSIVCHKLINGLIKSASKRK